MAYYTFSHLTTPDCSYPKCVATTVPLSRLQHHANWDITNQRAIFKKRVKYSCYISEVLPTIMRGQWHSTIVADGEWGKFIWNIILVRKNVTV